MAYIKSVSNWVDKTRCSARLASKVTLAHMPVAWSLQTTAPAAAALQRLTSLPCMHKCAHMHSMQACRVLRPGGICIIAFGPDCFKEKAWAGWLSRSMPERTQLLKRWVAAGGADFRLCSLKGCAA